ncbi:MAG: Crp/Fnr family transcriptional regulator [Gemmatimonadaceae bacterium]
MDHIDGTENTYTAPPGYSGDGRRATGDGPAGRPITAVRREGAAAAHEAESNRLLRALPVDEYDRLLGQLTPVRLRLKLVLAEPDVPITDVYFVRDGVASMLATEQEGGDIEVGTIGNEGLVGVPVLLGDDSMPNRVIVQVEGDAWRIDADAFRRVLEERPAVRRLCLRFVAYFAGQLSQSVACNRLHTLEERCARWLLMTHDRVHGDVFDLTHEFLALMLGVRRSGVTVAMGALQRAGIVRYSRGRITVLDRPRLEEASCDCYRITQVALDRLLG